MTRGGITMKMFKRQARGGGGSNKQQRITPPPLLHNNTPTNTNNTNNTTIDHTQPNNTNNTKNTNMNMNMNMKTNIISDMRGLRELICITVGLLLGMFHSGLFLILTLWILALSYHLYISSSSSSSSTSSLRNHNTNDTPDVNSSSTPQSSRSTPTPTLTTVSTTATKSTTATRARAPAGIDTPSSIPASVPTPTISSSDPSDNVAIVNCDELHLLTLNEEYHFENDCYKGKIMPMVRPKEADLSTDEIAACLDTPGLHRTKRHTIKYFASKQRRFEFQFQGKLKKEVHGQLYLAVEFTKPRQFGMVQRTVISTIFNLIRKLNKGFHFYIGVDTCRPDGAYQKQHMAFPIETSLDRIVVTKPGDKPPVLGNEIHEDAASVKARKKGTAAIAWNMEDTYTMCIWSAYMDWGQWRVMNLPGIRPFSLTNYTGPQTLSVKIYSLSSAQEGQDSVHNICDMNVITLFEIGNFVKTPGGLVQQAYDKTRGKERTLVELDNSEEDEDDEDDFDDDEILDEVDELLDDKYLQNNDLVVLSAVIDAHDHDSVSTKDVYVCNGGGFAVLQTAKTTCELEKVKSSKTNKGRSISSLIIRNGDTIRVKMSGPVSATDNTLIKRWLSTHRGWWLKWVRDRPNRNGLFTIHDDSISLGEPLQHCSKLVMRHKRWPNYEVGHSDFNSAVYGGQLLGLRKISATSKDCDAELLSNPDDPNEIKSKNGRVVPFQFCVFPVTTTPSQDLIPSPGSPVSKIDVKKMSIDSPTWIVMMHRSDRRIETVYAVRFLQAKSAPDVENKSFVRLRTTREITPILRKLLSIETKELLPSPVSIDEGVGPWDDAAVTPRDFDKGDVVSDMHFDGVGLLAMDVAIPDSELDETPTGVKKRCSSADDLLKCEKLAHLDEENSPRLSNNSIGNKWVLRPAKTSFHLVTKTGVKVVKGGVHVVKGGVNVSKKIGNATMFVGKGTLKAGKAIVSVGPNLALRRGEPRPNRVYKHMANQSRKMKNAHLSRINRYIKRGTKKGRFKSTLQPVAIQTKHELLLSRLSDIFLDVGSELVDSDEQRAVFNSLTVNSELDMWFLQGGATELGVVPSELSEKLIFEAIVARALWDTHWREEWCGLYDGYIAFYAPLSRKYSKYIRYNDVKKTRFVSSDESRDLFPGFSRMVAIETLWKVNYVVFYSDSIANEFMNALNSALESFSPVDADETLTVVSNNPMDEFQLGRWGAVSSKNKRFQRIILNCRHMPFDCVGPTVDLYHQSETELSPRLDEDLDSRDLLNLQKNVAKMVEETLHSALILRTNALEQSPVELRKFLRLASNLRAVNLYTLNFQSDECLCILINLYHCILQHALLVEGPPSRSTVERFMRCNCYELGDDIFSLAELEVVIRSSMSPPVHYKNTPFVLPSKAAKSRLHQRFRSEDFALVKDPRINFVLNHGFRCNPKFVQVFTIENFDDQLNSAVYEFFDAHLSVDKSKKCVYLPKVCDVYRNDFLQGQKVSYTSDEVVLAFCIPFIRESEDIDLITKYLNEGCVIRFNSVGWDFHDHLELFSNSE